MTSIAGIRFWNFCRRAGANSRPPGGLWLDHRRTHAGVMRMRTGKLIGGKTDTAMQHRGQHFASPRSWTVLGHGEFAATHSSRRRTACGQFEPVAAASSRTVEAHAWTGSQIARGRDCGRGLNADMDCSWTRTGCADVLIAAESSWRIIHACGHEPHPSRGCSALLPRPLRGRRNLRHEGVTRALS
jgi:hypothetical protein